MVHCEPECGSRYWTGSRPAIRRPDSPRWTMRAQRRLWVGVAAMLLAATRAAGADTAALVYKAMKLDTAQVLTGSVLAARVVPGEAKQVVAVVTYMTGKKDKADAVNVAFEVFSSSNDTLTSIYSMNLGAENGGNVGQGNL